MAVVRQNTQVFNKPIGVVRANAGASELGQAISQVAGAASDIIYREGAIRAEEAGTKAGIAQSADRIIAINPDTGLPEAYEAPSNFGTIASRAYQNMIDRRFEDSIGDEIKMRGQEIAADSANSEEFKNRMTAYVEQMYANAVTEDGGLNAYGRMIEEAGTAYVASAYTALRNKEAKAAKAALEAQQKLQFWKETREATAIINAGGDASALIDGLAKRTDDLLQSGSITATTYMKDIEKIDGLRALSNSNQLTNIYVAANPEQRALLKSAILNPELIANVSDDLGVSNLGQVIGFARTHASAASIISGLNSIETVETEYSENLVDTSVANYPRSPLSTVSHVNAYVSGLPDDIRGEVKSEILADTLADRSSILVADVESADLVLNELRKTAGFNKEVLSRILGDEAAQFVLSMSDEDRTSVAETLATRRASLNAIGNAEQKQRINGLGERIRSVVSAPAINLNEIESLRAEISAADIPAASKNNLDGALSAAYSSRILSDARFIELSASEMELVREAVRTQNPELLSTQNAKSAYALYSAAYDASESATDGEMGRVLEGLRDQAKRQADAARLTGILTDVEKGYTLPKEDLDDLDDTVFRNIRTLNGFLQNQTAMALFDRGVATPKMISAFKRSVNSNNPDEIAAGTQLFEKLSRMNLVGQETIAVDYARAIFNNDPETYALFAAASYAGRNLNIVPANALIALRQFEGGVSAIDVELRKELNLSKDARLSSVFAGMNVSRRYQTEILSMLRIMKANGSDVSRDSIESYIDDFENRAAADDRVIGPRIGDSTVYALKSYMSNGEIFAGENDLVNLMAESFENKRLLTGGTFLDAALANLAMIFPDPFDRSAAVMESFTGGYKAGRELSNEARLRNGLNAIGVDLKYWPNVASFEAGVPAWYVGYTTEEGVFKNIMINDAPYQLVKDLGDTSGDQLAAYNAYVLIAQSPATPEAKAEAELRMLAHRRGFDVRSDSGEYRRFEKLLGEETIDRIIKEVRE